MHDKEQQQLSEQKSESKKRKENIFTSNNPNAKIEMYDGSPKRSEHHASTDQDPADHHHRSAAIAVDKYAAYRSCTDKRKTCLWGGTLSWSPRLLRLSLLLTSGIHWSKHDWGHPGNLTVGNGEILLNLLVVDGEGLGKGIGESDGNESPKDDGPTPASIWRGVAKVAWWCWGHAASPRLNGGKQVREEKSFKPLYFQVIMTITTEHTKRTCCKRSPQQSSWECVAQSSNPAAVMACGYLPRYAKAFDPIVHAWAINTSDHSHQQGSDPTGDCNLKTAIVHMNRDSKSTLDKEGSAGWNKRNRKFCVFLFKSLAAASHCPVSEKDAPPWRIGTPTLTWREASHSRTLGEDAPPYDFKTKKNIC